MTVIQFAEVLRRFGVDVLLLAVGVTLLTSLLKKTVMKSLSKKVFVFLPFGIGILVYFLYRLIAGGGICFTAEELFGILSSGVGCGSAATLYYVFYEQFLRGRTVMDPLLPLLDCIPEEKREEAAQKIEAEFGRPKEELVEAVRRILSEYADPPLTDEEREATVLLLEAYISDIA